MNNKDLFNAINDIDEKFITDAGKYLKNDFGGFRDEEPIEVRPAERTFSPMRWIAPIAATIVLFVGIGVALKAGIITINLQPLRQQTSAYNAAGAGESDGALNNAPAASADRTSVGGAQATSDKAGSPTATALELDKALPFALYGPDMEQIKYSEVTSFGGLEGSEKLNVRDLNEDNWGAIGCDFAYINEPRGANYNSIEIPGMFNDDVHFADSGSFKRVYKGDMFGDLTVSDAYCVFRKYFEGDFSPNTDKWTLSAERFLKESFVSFSGEVTAEGFLIKDESGSYRFIMIGGESQIPAMNFVPHSADGSYTTYMVYEAINGYKYMGELPSIEVKVDDAWGIDNYYPGRNWQRVQVTLSDISVIYTVNKRGGTINYEYHVSAKVEKAVPDYSFNYEDNAVNEIETRILEKINSAETVADLNDMYEMLYELNLNCKYFRVFYPVDTENGVEVEVLEDGELSPGMMIYLYDEDDKVIGIYTYRKHMM